jgi:hypothetical protein
MRASKAATPYQFAQTGCQAHDAIDTLMSTILNNKTQHKLQSSVLSLTMKQPSLRSTATDSPYWRTR